MPAQARIYPAWEPISGPLLAGFSFSENPTGIISNLERRTFFPSYPNMSPGLALGNT
jgi:hypothetical protein